MIKKILMHSYLLIVLTFIYIPLALIFVFSFINSKTLNNWSGGFTLQLYADLFTGQHSSVIMSALLNTLIIAFASSVLALIFGTLGAIGVNSMRKRARNASSTVTKFPMINAEIITAISLLIFFASLNIQSGYFTLIVAHTAFCTPYVLLSVLPKLQQVNNNTYEAALDLGATPFQAMSKIIVPQIFPAMISGFLMAFTISLDDFVITQFNKGSIQTFSTYIYTAGLRKPLPMEVRALSVLIFLFALALLLISNRMSNKNRKKNGENI